jgi:hypothetical protein
MSFDEQPDGDPHGECAAEIQRLQVKNQELVSKLLDVQSQLEHGAWFEERSEIVDFIINAVHSTRETGGNHG